MAINLSRDEIRGLYRQGEDAVVAFIENLIERFNKLEEDVAKLKAQKAKDSHNSSKPPSSDPFRKTNNLRQKSGKSSGGQPGHVGSTLPMSDTPDVVEEYAVRGTCTCGFCLEDVAAVEYERRQEVDIPKVKPKVTEHRAWIKRCPGCGKIHKGQFPANVKAPVQYGCQTKATITYLNQYQLIPFDRTAELLKHLFGMPISEGSLVTFAKQAHSGLEKTDEVIVENIRKAEVGHFDESGLYVEKKRGWLNVAGTTRFTRFFFHDKRGKEAMDAAGILPHFGGTAVHDGLKAYFLYQSCKHGLCNVHHLRELKFQVEQYHQQWADDMAKHLLEIKAQVATARESGQNSLDQKTLIAFEKRFDEIILQGYEQNPPATNIRKPGQRGRTAQSSTRNLLDRLKKYRAETLLFMHDFNVPFENNLAERDGRMVKLQQKISGCFRSRDGAHAFCRIRSYISTIKKQGYDVLDALSKIFSVNDGSVNLLPE